MDIQTTLLTSLRKLAEQHTMQTLGDRGGYLGASDIGYCPRKIILDKIHPACHDLATLLRFQRGHMAEEIIARAFTAAGYDNFERQVEIVLADDIPLRAHLDFVFTSQSHRIKSVLEIKSTSRIPDGAYGSWESQLYLQMGGLARQHPEYTVRGAILVLDLAHGDVGFFNGYEPEETIYRGLIERAGTIWSQYQAMLQGVEPEMKTEVTPLCGYCGHIATCPRFETEEVPQLAGVVEALQELQAREKNLQGQIKHIKGHLFAVVEQQGPIKSGGCLLRKATRSRKHLDMTRLETFLTQNGSVIDEYQEEREFSFLEIRKAKAA